MQNCTHAFHNGLVFLHWKRCMIVSVALPHSLQKFSGACLCFLLRTYVALCSTTGER